MDLTFGLDFGLGLWLDNILIFKRWVAIKNCKILASQLGFELGVVRGFQKGITLLEVFIFWVCKNGMPKICKNLAFELRFKLGVMRGFQKGITIRGRASGSFQNS